jgi:hypothetical protein
MSWSLQLRNGDLTVEGAKLGQVTGSNKLIQDLRCALLEARGSDDLHPKFGSLIDGGINDEGQPVPSVIANTNWELAALRIETEIRRIAAEHQRRQLTRAQSDRRTYGESTLSNTELLAEISGIQMFQAQDKLLVQVSLRLGDHQTRTIDIPLPINI